MKNLLRLWKYVKRYPGLLALGLAGAVLTKLMQLYIPYLMKFAVDAVFRLPVDVWFVIYVVIGMAVIKAAESVTEFIWRRRLISMSHHVAFDLRNSFYRHILKLSFSWFNQARTGDIMSRATNDIQEVRGMFEFAVANILRNLVLLVGCVTMMFLTSPELTLLTMLPLLSIAILVRFILPKIYARSMKVQEQLAAVSSCAQENFSGIRVIKAFAVEDVEKKNFANLSQDYADKAMSLVKLRAFMMPMFMTAVLLCWLLALWFGGREIVFGRFTIGDLFKFIAYTRMMLWPMASFGMIIARLQRGGAAMTRINRIMDVEPEIKDDQRTGPDMDIRGEIELRNLTFTYPGSAFSLKDISLLIPPGATVGIVGAIGSGKSSFVSLLMRLFDVPDGTLFLDGRDINTVPVRKVRSSMGYVPQDSFLFSETVRGNISFGKPDVDFASILEAARVARVNDDIEQFPDKYDQLIGERGVTLSGGQKQRIAIARALLLEPKILILDDALSSVDTHTEEEILTGLRAYAESRTTLIISHRISTVASADFIIVFDDGRIAERGTHAELVALGGIYASTYRKQQLESEIESEGD